MLAVRHNSEECMSANDDGAGDRGAHVVNVDEWDGYAAARTRLFPHIADNTIDNLVALTGNSLISRGNRRVVIRSSFAGQAGVTRGSII